MSGKNNANTVQGTNDSSIVSKHAMIEAGYAQDPFLQAFTLKTAPRRAPLINRGYYIRTKAIRDIIRSFLTCDKNPKQIISLGAGFDTTYFSLLVSDDTASMMKDVYYLEVDFPEVVKRKKKLISCSSLCSDVLKPQTKHFDDVTEISTSNYCLVGADLADLKLLEHKWTKHTRLDKSLHTLLLSECVMTYMDHTLSTNLITFCQSMFPCSMFVTYEQVEPYDAFGQFMRAHFDKLNSSLKGICTYNDKQAQVDRYKNCGYAEVSGYISIT